MAGWVEVPIIEVSDDEVTETPPKRLRTWGTAVFDDCGEDFLHHLAQQGYAVLRGVLKDDCGAFREEVSGALSAVAGGRFPPGFRGIVSSYGLPQADFAWRVRGHWRLREAFAAIFGCHDLVVSLDAVILQAGQAKSLPWLHKDQHPRRQSLSVQAVYTHYGSGPHDAGTCVVPGSHLTTYAWEQDARNDFIRVPTDCSFQVLKPSVPPDSVVFFNSRLIHASVSGTQITPGRAARLGLCVAYAPRARRSEQTRRKKEKAYLQGKCSTHWPCDNFSLKPPMKAYQMLKGARQLPPPPPLKERLDLL